MAQRHTEHTPPHSAKGDEKSSFSLSVSGHLLWVVLATELDRQDTGPFGKDLPVGMKLDGHKDSTWMHVTPGNAGEMGRQVKSTKHGHAVSAQPNWKSGLVQSQPPAGWGPWARQSAALGPLSLNHKRGNWIRWFWGSVTMQPLEPTTQSFSSLTLQVAEAHSREAGGTGGCREGVGAGMGLWLQTAVGLNLGCHVCFVSL